MNFKNRMENISIKKGSRIVLALDFPYHNPSQSTQLFKKAAQILKDVNSSICAVKINHHLTLPLGLFDGIQKLVDLAHNLDLLTIMDCKLNDIGATNEIMSKYYYSAGFDALIANPFVGWEQGLEPVFDISSRLNRGIILLVYMSHKGSIEGYGQTIIDNSSSTKQYLEFAKKALNYKADGAVVGATFPEKISEIFQILGEKVPIFSPGVGAQGGTGNAAIESGARYIIVGREITQSLNPSKNAQKLLTSINLNKTLN